MTQAVNRVMTFAMNPCDWYVSSATCQFQWQIVISDILHVKPTGTKHDIQKQQKMAFYRIIRRKLSKSMPHPIPMLTVCISAFVVAPKIKTPMTELRIKAGQILHIDIDYIGEPDPTVEWLVNGHPLKLSDRSVPESPQGQCQRSPQGQCQRSPQGQCQRSLQCQCQRSLQGQSQRSPQGQCQRSPQGQSQRSPRGQSQRSSYQSQRSPQGQSQRSPKGQSQRSP